MSKINNKQITYSIILGLGILAILALGIMALIPKQAHADTAGRVTPYGSTRFTNVISNAGYNSYVGGDEDYSSPEVIYYPHEPRVVYVNRTTTEKVVNTNTQEDTEPKEEFSDLAGNALFGNSNFMPSSLTAWILFAIFILIIVIVVRKVFGHEEAYHSTPLKHS